MFPRPGVEATKPRIETFGVKYSVRLPGWNNAYSSVREYDPYKLYGIQTDNKVSVPIDLKITIGLLHSWWTNHKILGSESVSITNRLYQQALIRLFTTEKEVKELISGTEKRISRVCAAEKRRSWLASNKKEIAWILFPKGLPLKIDGKTYTIKARKYDLDQPNYIDVRLELASYIEEEKTGPFSRTKRSILKSINQYNKTRRNRCIDRHCKLSKAFKKHEINSMKDT